MSQQILTLTPASAFASVNTSFTPKLMSVVNFAPWPLAVNYSNQEPTENSYDIYLPANSSSVFPAIGTAYCAALLVSGAIPQKVLPCYVVLTDEPLYTQFGQLIDPLQGVNVTMLVRIVSADWNSGSLTMPAGFGGVLHSYTVPAGFFGVLRSSNLLIGTIFGVTGELSVQIDGFYAQILNSDPAAGGLIRSDRLAWEAPLPAGTVVELWGSNPGGGGMAYEVSWYVDLIPLT